MYAMAHALDQMVSDSCGAPMIGPLTKEEALKSRSRHLCAELTPKPDGAELLKYVRNVSFVSKSWIIRILHKRTSMF